MSFHSKETSPRRKQQQDLFRTLGTLARTRVTLESIARSNWSTNTPGVKVTALQQRVLDAAAYVLTDLYKEAQYKITHIPK